MGVYHYIKQMSTSFIAYLCIDYLQLLLNTARPVIVTYGLWISATIQIRSVSRTLPPRGQSTCTKWYLWQFHGCRFQICGA